MEKIADQDTVIETLDDLSENCKDGEYGFAKCAENAKSAELKTFFARRAQGCREAAAELRALIVSMGGEPDTGGTTAGALHRGWLAVRGALALNDDKAMLVECERGEDAALARYRKALEENLPPDVEQLVRRQLEGAQRNHDEVKRLRDSVIATTA